MVFTDAQTIERDARIAGIVMAGAVPPVRAPLRDGDPRRVGRYRLTARLGAGGMGVVYLGVGGDGRLVAVKVMRPELADDPEFRARFGREVAVLARVRGTRIVRVIEAGADACGPFLVTEYAAGPSLAEYVGAAGPLATGTLFDLAAGLAEALAVIHSAGVVHRDLKPSNVILTLDGPKVIDFGIAQVLDSVSLTRTGTTVGSAGYMAPEQVMGQAGPAADIFAWAGTIAYAASGQPPFGTGATDAVVYRILHAQPSTGDVPEVLRPVIKAALAKEPQDRPAAHEIIDQLAASSAAFTWARPGGAVPVPTVLSPASPPTQPETTGPETTGPGASEPEATQPRRQVPAVPKPARRRLTARDAIVPATVLAVAGVLALAVLPGQGARTARLASGQGAASARQLAPSGPFDTYLGEQDRGVFQTISRVASWGNTIVTTGAQASDGVVRQQFLTSADGGASWRLAPVRAAGGGPLPAGYQATRIAGGPAGWVAIGTSGPQAIWTSRDGLSWTLAATHGIPQRPGDQVWVLSATADGFLAAGQAKAPGGRTQAVIWTSRDGVTWQRTTAGLGQGVAGIYYAATLGAGTVISDGQSGAWLSTDGGSSWTPVSIPAGHGAGNGLAGLGSDGHGLIAIRPGTAGNGISYFSPNGRTWQYSGTIGASGGFRPSVVKGSADGFVVTGTDAAGNYVAYASTGTGTTWVPTGSLGTAAGYTSAPTATAGAGGTVIAAGTAVASKVSQQAVLLRAGAGGAVQPVPLAGIPGAVIPEVSVKSLAVAEGEQVAVGSADGYPAIWRKTAAGSWKLVSTLAQVSAGPRLGALTSVTTDGDDWLAVGVPGPIAFTSEDGTTWQAAPGIARDLASVTGDVVGVAAAAGPGGYAIVGKVVAPGGSCLADVWWAPEDGRWIRAHDVNDTSGSSQVLAAAADGHGFISAGSHNDQPAVWTTGHGPSWKTIVLPLPSGTTGVLQQVAVHGSHVVVLGQQTTAGVITPLAELSTDGGATFTQVPFGTPSPFGAPSPDAGFTALTADAAGFTAAAQSGTAGATVWTTADGTTWTPSAARLPSGTSQLMALAPADRKVTAIGSAATTQPVVLTLTGRP